MSKRQTNAEKVLHNEIIGVVFIAFAVLIFFSLTGFQIGSIGTMIDKILLYALGKGAFLFVVFLLLVGIRFIFKEKQEVFSAKFLCATAFFLDLLFLFHQYVAPANSELLPESLTSGGGVVSGFIIFAARKVFGLDGTWVFLIALALCLAIISFKISLKKTVEHAEKGVKEIKTVAQNTRKHVKNSSIFNYEKVWGPDDMDNEVDSNIKVEHVEEEQEQEEEIFILPEKEHSFIEIEQNEPPEITKEDLPINDVPILTGAYRYPHPGLLKQPQNIATKDDADEVDEQAAILEQTLADFKVSAKIVNIVNGPAVTRFEVEPAPGVKVNKIAGLVDDLTLRLKVSGIRIETSIPGKSAMGIEVPKKNVSPVMFYDVVTAKDFKEDNARLAIALGKDITGNTIVSDISKMPHLLVAGSTGSGKSVCINTIVNSILFKSTPDEVKFIMIDPKVVELSTYNGIPHLLVPVVTNAKKAASALFWAVEEMEKRYNLFAESGVREITRFNTINSEKLPYIVIIIDELADLMMVAPGDVEDAICRLAQKARAAGLHLILATQRPSVDVITGIIKANIPSRIAFAVSSQVDSRTILDSGGAEKLLGKGDMLYYPAGMSKPLRLQGAFISDEEIENITNYIKEQSIPVEYTESVTEHLLPSEKKKNGSDAVMQNESAAEQDELLEQALEIIMQTGQASASMLQRRLRIGYTRAARLVDIFEEHSIVGPSTGTSKPRDILLSHEEASRLLGFSIDD